MSYGGPRRFSYLPYWAQTGGAKAVVQRLREPEVRARLRQDWEENRVEWDNRSGVRDWADILVTDGDARPEVLGKNIAEIAAAEGKDPLETAFDLISAPCIAATAHGGERFPIRSGGRWAGIPTLHVT